MEDNGMITAGGAKEIVNPCWDLQSSNYIRDTSIDSAEYVKLYQQGGFNPTNSPVAQTDWHFRMSDLNSWYLMAQSFFEFNFTITDQTEEPAETTINLVYPSDMRCLFKNVQLDLNSVAIESNNQNAFMFYNIDRAFMSRQYIETAGSMGGQFLTDVKWDNPALLGSNASRAFGINNAAGDDAGAYNGDLARLQTYAKKRVLCNIPLGADPTQSTQCTLRVAMPDIFNFYRYWTRVQKGLDTQVRFTTVGDGAFLTDRRRHTTGEGGAPRPAGDYRMDWAGAGITWWCRSLKPSPRVEAGLNAMLQKGAEIFCPFETAKVYNFSPASGNQSYRIVNESSRVMRMIVAFQRKTTQTSTDDISVLQMPDGMDSFTAFVNGKKVPSIDMRVRSCEPPPHQGFRIDGGVVSDPKFDYTELYHRFLLQTGTYNSAFKNNYSKGSGALGYVDWSSVSPFVTFDLSQNAIGDISGSNSEIVLNYNHVSKGNVQTETYTPLEAYNMYCVVYTERVVSLNLAESSSYVAIR